MKRILSFFLVLCMVLSLIPAVFAEEGGTTPTETKVVTTAPATTEIDKYGDVRLSINSGEFLAAGFDYADLVTVEFLDKTLTLPVIPEYRYVGAREAGLVAWNDATKPVELEIFNGSFAATYGLATKTTTEGNNYVWNANEGVTFPVEIKITLAVKDGYRAQYEIFDLKRTNDRKDYPDLTDEQFANFRAVSTTGMGTSMLYRSSSPINPAIGRNTYADKAAQAHGVKTIMNLADNQKKAAAYAGYAGTYYAKQDVVFLGVGVDFLSDTNRTGLAEGLRYFVTHKGPYLVHCNEGQDRAGFVSALLECLMGATLDEVKADYATTYQNYYGVKLGTEQYATISGNIVKNLKTIFGVEELTDATLAAQAEAYIKGLGLTDEEVAKLRDNLSAHRYELVADSSNMFKYGHLDLKVSTEAFLKVFEYGDIVTVSFNDKSYDFPVCSNYDDVDTHALLIRAATGKNVVTLAINYGQIGVEAGIIEAAPEGSTTKYRLKEGVTFPIYATVTLKEAGGYKDELSVRQLNRTNVRAEYPELTDEQFANFRSIATTGMGKGVLYRSSSPINPELGRNTYADKAAAAAGIKTFINLADTEAEAKGYEGFGESYYAKQNVIFLGLPVAFTTKEFKDGLAEGFRYMTKNEGPYLVHCTEGKDRAGLASAILECFMGASAEEVANDYVTTFRNYYNVVDGKQIALTEAQVAYLKNVILKNLCLIFDMKDAAKADLKAEATAYLKEIGLTEAEIQKLAENLGGKTEFVNPFTDVKEGVWYYEYVMKMTEKEIIKGMTATTFEPDGQLTRAQTAMLLYRIAGEPAVEGTASFTDVAKDIWYAKAVAWAEKEGVVNGMTKTTFEPEGKVTRAQFVTMLYRFAGKPENKTASTFTDVKDGWYKDAVAWAETTKIVNGMTETTFEPDGTCTRAQAAKILCIFMHMPK